MLIPNPYRGKSLFCLKVQEGQPKNSSWEASQSGQNQRDHISASSTTSKGETE